MPGAVTFDILARDGASRILEHVGHEVNGLRGHLHGLATGAVHLAKYGLISGATAATAGFVYALDTGIKKTADYDTGLARLQAGLKSTHDASNTTAKGLESLAQKIQGYSGQTADSIVSTEQLLLTFTKLRNVQGKGNDVFTRTTKLAADMAARLGGDASKSAVKLGKAMQDPVKGMGALSRVGVVFSTKQKDVIKKLVESGHTLKAQKLILGELDKKFAGSARAVGATLPGQIERLKRKFEEWSQSLVEHLLPALFKLGGWIKEKVTPALRPLGQAFYLVQEAWKSVVLGFQNRGPLEHATGVFRTIQSVIGALVNFVTGKVLPSIANLWSIFQSLLPTLGVLAVLIGVTLFGALNTIGSVVKTVTGFFDEHRSTLAAVVGVVAALTAVTLAYSTVLKVQEAGGLLKMAKATTIATKAAKVFAAVQWLVNAALDANPIGIAIVAIAALTAGFIIAYKHSRTFRNIVHAAMHGVAAAFDFVRNHWRIFALAFAALVGGPIIAAIVLLVTHFGAVKRVALTVFHAISSAAGAVVGFIRAHWQLLLAIMVGPIAAAVVLIRGHLGGILRFIGSIPGRIQGFFAGAGGWLVGAGEKILGGLLTGLQHAAGAALDFVKSIPSKIVSFFPHSPAKRGALRDHPPRSWGVKIMDELVAGLQKRQASLEKELTNVTDKLSSIRDAAKSMASGVRDSLTGVFDIANAPNLSAKGITHFLATGVAQTKRFVGLLARLVKAGFLPSIVQQIAAMGVGPGTAAAINLLHATPAERRRVNNLERQLDRYATQGGRTVARQQYGKAIDRLQARLDRLHDDLVDVKHALRDALIAQRHAQHTAKARTAKS